ncbi:MAG: type III pantothenate kinase [Cyclobacteriaceae bacterium]|nr:type III pantothenate kinase [Cyclobacteriaceae bacterium]
MNLAIDHGNTRIKAGVFEQTNLIQTLSFEDSNTFNKWLDKNEFENAIVSSVARSTDNLMDKINSNGKKIFMSQSTPFPIAVKYSTPLTLGLDRIAAACGTLDIIPGGHRLAIDLGTCINYEFVDDLANYYGGAISPGVKMRFEAMHTFTARLPLVNFVDNPPLVGNSTESCMQSGVVNGVLAELEGIIDRYQKKYPTMGVILCGGDAPLFENKLKHPIFVAPNLVLSGLNKILLHNVNL